MTLESIFYQSIYVLHGLMERLPRIYRMGLTLLWVGRGRCTDADGELECDVNCGKVIDWFSQFIDTQI